MTVPTTMATDPLFDRLRLDELRRRPGVKWQRVAGDVLPAWVADMDFAVPQVVAEAISDTVHNGDLGYPNWPDGNPLRAGFADRMRERHGWQIAASDVREHTDLIQGLQLLLHLSTKPGDAVAVQTPNYPPFLATIDTMRRKRVNSPWLRTSEGWVPDIAGLADAVASHDCRVLVLVNPHNPTGRVLSREELAEIAAIAHRHDLLVISDEIHAELVFAPHEHVPFASLSKDTAARTVTLSSAGKAFNIAGLRCSVVHYGPRRLLALRDAQPPDLYGVVSPLSVAGTLAAWRHGAEWQNRLMRVLDRNRRRVAEAVREWAGDAAEPMPEATYLYWFRAQHLGLSGNDPVGETLRRAKVLLDGGPGFGPDAEQYLRLNFATSASLLEDILARLGTMARHSRGT
ncbi:aminotransferase class I/II-fold pyridoxal phosphate-dependent enzyme [Kibdelosporangium persicum]|uniref:cysteine-S-conjugate beta-lyase n=1 Tax=Kibdelosporangium persicum TaxID=2698649 RepID=A0ABX2F5K1_9PSEU|nr:aminotransferase class I/II-fold pyridoxal phosphate-dependent enzyme [Kibdelosporangium persicum]NRN66434.1 Aminotransferase class I/II-fold pyridoxal phosphate-dependent enzyme [Kibdelosporangium persicum]